MTSERDTGLLDCVCLLFSWNAVAQNRVAGLASGVSWWTCQNPDDGVYRTLPCMGCIDHGDSNSMRHL